MKPKFSGLCQIRYVLCGFRSIYRPLYTKDSIFSKCLFSSLINPTETLVDDNKVEDFSSDCRPKDPIEVFMRWGCTENDVAKIFKRTPALQRCNPIWLQTRLNYLGELGIGSPDLIKIISCRPRLLTCRIQNNTFKERLDYLQKLFESREVLHKAIVRNPSLLTYDVDTEVKPVIESYIKMGIREKDLVKMFSTRPTMIPRTLFNDEKLEYIRKTGVKKESKLYKYVVCLFAVSRVGTIQEKVANLEKFGFSDDEIFGLFGRSPLLLTLSIDKIQRNMTFVLGTMKLTAKVALTKPFLFFLNLEAVLKPRVLFLKKIQHMGLKEQMDESALLTALRMKEHRFVKAFISCHPEEVAQELMGCYTKLKSVKRLAESSKRPVLKGFPF